MTSVTRPCKRPGARRSQTHHEAQLVDRRPGRWSGSATRRSEVDLPDGAVRFPLAPDLGQEHPAFAGQLLLGPPLPLRLGPEPIQLALPQLQASLGVPHLLLVRLGQLFDQDLPVERVAVMHAQAPEEAAQLRARLTDSLGPEARIEMSQIGTVLATHTGPRALGIAYIKEK